jgi:hypothetical protein
MKRNLLVYELRDRNPELNLDTSGISSSVERLLWEQDALGSIPRSPTIAQSCSSVAERAPDEGYVKGAIPFTTTTWGELCPRQRHQHTNLTDGFVLRSRLTSRTPDFDSGDLGVEPSTAALWLSSKDKTKGCGPLNWSLILRSHPTCACSKDSNAAGCNPAKQPCKSAQVLHAPIAQCRGDGFKPRAVRTRFPLGVNKPMYANAERSVSKTLGWGCESLDGYHALLFQCREDGLRNHTVSARS